MQHSERPVSEEKKTELHDYKYNLGQETIPKGKKYLPSLFEDQISLGHWLNHASFYLELRPLPAPQYNLHMRIQMTEHITLLIKDNIITKQV